MASPKKTISKAVARPVKKRAKAVTPSQKVDNETFRSFIENLPVMFYAVQPNPPYAPIYISGAVEKFGYPREDWMRDPDFWVRVIHDEDRDRILGATKLAMSTGDGIDFEYRIVGKDGKIFWVRDRSCFIRDAAGQPFCWQGVILDVTERKLAVLELQKREKLYRTLARHIPKTSVLLFDHDFRYTLVDGAQLDEGDYALEKFEGKTLSEIVPPEIFDEWAGYYSRALAGEKVVVDADNEIGSFQVSIVPVMDEQDEIFAGMVVWQDVTDRLAADEALMESEARYRQLFENANDVIYIHDLEGHYISINGAAQSIFGYSQEEALDLNMASIIAPEHVPIVKENLAKKLAGGTSQTVYEVDCIRKDGRRITLEVNSSVIEKDGSPVAIQGVARDITKRKVAEEISRKNEERYRDLFENANDLIYTHDMSGNFTSLNRAGELITGYSREEAIEMNIESVVAPEFLEGARTMTARKRKDERPTTYELEIVAKDGRRVPLELSTRLIVNDGLPIGVQGIGRDISERKHAQESLHNTISLFASTFESTADGIIVMSLEREIVTCNKKFLEMWQTSEDMVHGKTGEQLVESVIGKIKNADEFLKNLECLYSDVDGA